LGLIAFWKTILPLHERQCSVFISCYPQILLTSRIVKGKESISGFDSSKHRAFLPRKAIANLFGIHTTGQRAKSLLPDLFETHNLLYAERIVQFLDADKRGKLHQVLNESVAGRATMDQWGRIEAAKLVIVRQLRERKESIIDVRTRMTEFKEQLASFQLKDADDLEAKWKKIYTSSPLIINLFQENIGDNKSVPPSPDILIHLETHVQDIKTLCDEISTELGAYEGGKWKSVREVSREHTRIQKSINNTQGQVSKKEKEIWGLQQEIAKKEKHKSKTSVEIVSKHNLLKNLTSFEIVIKTVIDWLPEIMAGQRTAELERELNRTKERNRNLEAAAEKMDLLPSVEAIYITIQQLDSSTKALPVTKAEAAELEQAHHSKKQKVKEIEDSLQQHRAQNEMAEKAFLELHGRLEEYLKLISTKHCPSCGTAFDSPEELLSAIETSREAAECFGGLSGIEKDIEKKLILEREISKLVDKKEKLDKEIAERNSMIKNSAENINLYEKYITECEIAFRLASFDISENAEKSLSERVEKLSRIPVESLITGVHKTILSLSEEIGGIWKELRRDEYLTKRYEIEEFIAKVQEICQKHNFQHPEELKMESYALLLKNVQEMKRQAREDVVTLENLVEISRNEIALLSQEMTGGKQQLEEYERGFRRFNATLEKIALLKTKYERVSRAGLIGENETLDAESVAKELSGILVALETLKQKVIQQDENDKLKVHIKEEFSGLDKKEKKLVKHITKLRLFLAKLKKTQSPQDHTAHVLKKHKKPINRFFQNLHWPRDFDDVRFELGKNFEITVRNITKDKRCAAHDELSAGQRAALAISVFWTLNTSFKNLPNILLMDEPVQNIDELNMLNFLDGLRWFVETTNRQVFITTANQRIEALVKKKFVYLKDDFLELVLKREYGCTRINYVGWDGEEIANGRMRTPVKL